MFSWLFRRRFLDAEQEKQILAAIREAEAGTSGEIRVHIAAKLKNGLMEDAAAAFSKMGMHKTELRNGVLVFISWNDHQVAIIGDQGINEKVPAGFWDNALAAMTERFRENDMAGGISAAVRMAGQQLSAFFPRSGNNRNELKDTVSYG